MNEIKIRQERPSDYAEVYELVKISFATSSHADGDEQDYLNEVRQKPAFVPELSLVAETAEGRLVGQIVLYETDITTPGGKRTELLLSPICVHPGYFRRGIARAMIERAFAIAGGMGYGAVFLCGNPALYARMGFRPTYEYGILHVGDPKGNAMWSMVREIYPGALEGITGSINTI